jgi:O-antigen ligase
MMVRLGLIYPALGAIRIELVVALIVLLRLAVGAKGDRTILALHYNPVNKYMFLFFLVMTASFFQAWDYAVSWNNGLLEFIKIYIFFLMILLGVRTERQIRLFLWAFACLTIVIGYEGLYVYLTGNASYVFQNIEVGISSKGFASSHVAAALMQLQALPIMYYLLRSERSKSLKAFACLLSIISVFAIIASGSRGGFVGLLVFAALVVYFSKRRALALALAALVLLAALPFLPDTYLSWMGTSTSFSDDSSASRITGLINGLEMMIRRPILGVGPECYPLARKAWFHWGLEAHNHYGQLMGDLGLLGTVAWTAFIIHVFRNLARAKQGFLQARVGSMVYLVTGFQVALMVRLFEGMASHSLYVFFWYMTAALSTVLVATTQNPRHVPVDPQAGGAKFHNFFPGPRRRFSTDVSAPERKP